MSSASRTSSSTATGLSFRIYRVCQWLVIIAVIVGGIWAWQLLRQPDRFPVQSVKIEASWHHVNRQAVQQLIMPYVLARGFFSLDVNGIRQKLMQMPWVAEAKVQRVWPGTLVIKITEQRAMARFGDKALLNEKGQLFYPPLTSFPSGLPVLRCQPDKLTKVWEYYQQINQIIAPLGLTTRELDLTRRHSVTLVLSNGTRLFLGHTQIFYRLKRFVVVYPQIFVSKEAHAESVDLRYENGLTVKWREAKLKNP